MSASVVVFDLDGTLVDTAPDLVASLNHAVTQAGLAPVTYDDLTHLVGHGAKAMIERTFTLRGQTLSSTDLNWQMKEFIDFYHGSMPGDSFPYPGVVTAMDRLTDAGYTLAVCTNKLEMLAKSLLEGLGLASRFAGHHRRRYLSGSQARCRTSAIDHPPCRWITGKVRHDRR